MKLTIVHGDAFDVLAELEPDSVSAIVTDPPYGLEFMGKTWDRFREDDPGTERHRGEAAGEHGAVGMDKQGHPAGRASVAYGGGTRPTTSRCEGCGKRDQFRKPHGCPDGTKWRREFIDPHAAPPSMLAFQSWCREWGRLALRALRPGGHVLAFGGTRTYHRMACGLEDAGFEVRDCLQWLYGNGFPKSLDVSKAIDAVAGATREVSGPGRYAGRESESDLGRMNDDAWEGGGARVETAPATEDAERWQGWGTALKPAHEPIVLARKPLAGTVAATVLEHGTGALNVDGCRIDFRSEADRESAIVGGRVTSAHGGAQPNIDGAERREHTQTLGAGRWPANVVMDEAAAAMLDVQAPDTGGGGGTSTRGRGGSVYAGGEGFANTLAETGQPIGYGDGVGGASRFLYVAKADTAERNAGLGVPSLFTPQDAPEANDHPTVKPIDLMRWLVRLVTPPGGLVLDPFVGSGSTGIACALEGFDFLGIEQDADSVAIARARLSHWSNGEAVHDGR